MHWVISSRGPLDDENNISRIEPIDPANVTHGAKDPKVLV